MMFGLMAVANKFVPWYYGEGFDGVVPILISTAPILVAIGLSGITGIQYLVQIGKQKEFTISVTAGAIINVIINAILIRFWGGMGAAIASVIAEISILAIQLIYIKDEISIWEILKLSIKCIISGITMFIVVKILANYMSVSILNTIIEVIVGGIVYITMLIILRYQFFIDLYNQIIGGIKAKYRKEQ